MTEFLKQLPRAEEAEVTTMNLLLRIPEDMAGEPPKNILYVLSDKLMTAYNEIVQNFVQLASSFPIDLPEISAIPLERVREPASNVVKLLIEFDRNLQKFEQVRDFLFQMRELLVYSIRRTMDPQNYFPVLTTILATADWLPDTLLQDEKDLTNLEPERVQEELLRIGRRMLSLSPSDKILKIVVELAARLDEIEKELAQQRDEERSKFLGSVTATLLSVLQSLTDRQEQELGTFFDRVRQSLSKSEKSIAERIELLKLTHPSKIQKTLMDEIKSCIGDIQNQLQSTEDHTHAVQISESDTQMLQRVSEIRKKIENLQKKLIEVGEKDNVSLDLQSIEQDFENVAKELQRTRENLEIIQGRMVETQSNDFLLQEIARLGQQINALQVPPGANAEVPPAHAEILRHEMQLNNDIRRQGNQITQLVRRVVQIGDRVRRRPGQEQAIVELLRRPQMGNGRMTILAMFCVSMFSLLYVSARLGVSFDAGHVP
jgi:hypothetical protein